MRRRRLLSLLGSAALTAGLAVAVPTTGAQAAVGTAADSGARVVSETRVDARTIDIVVDSPALRGRASVRLLLPRDWAAQPTRKWPEVWLFHGANEPKDYQSWTYFTNVEKLLADKNVLAVLPSAGSAALYSDPVSLLAFGGSKYETFHMKELPQIIARGYRGNAQRVAVGLSSGGMGAVKYTARYPGMFRAAATFSGLLDTYGSQAVVATIETRALKPVGWTWGSPLLGFTTWQASNPVSLVDRLAGVPLYVSSGNGQNGPLDPAGSSADLVIEPAADASARRFVALAQARGVPVETDLYGPGKHSWPYWQRELWRAWPFVARNLNL